MVRRFFHQPDPVSGLAAWARRLALFAVLVAILSVGIVRFGVLDLRPALATFFAALACAAISLLLAVAAFAGIWHSGARGLGRAVFAIGLDVALLAYPAYLGWQYRKVPAINDITTDPIDPPRFEALARLRGVDGANPAVYAGLYSAEQQRAAYPDISPVQLDVPVQRAFEIATTLVAKRRWLVIDERAPQLPRRVGRIEAVARTPVMGFREDISIRVTPDGTGSRIDIRSSSRNFSSDLGSNAARVAQLVDDINTAAETESPSKPAPAAAKPQPKAKKS